MRILLLCTVLLSLACGGLLGTPLEQSEKRFKWRIDDLAELQTQAVDPELKGRIQATIEKHQSAYDAAPAEEDARVEAIAVITDLSRKEIQGFEAELATEKERQELVAAAQHEKYRRNWDGRWSGQGHVLNIGSNDSVHYENNSGSMNKTIDAGLVELTQKKLVVGALGINTTFTIEQPPTQIDEKTWVMKLDGVTYTWLGM